MSDLLPCPFCGDLMTTWLEESHAIHKDNRANCPLASLSLRIEVWNTRAPAQGSFQQRCALQVLRREKGEG